MFNKIMLLLIFIGAILIVYQYSSVEALKNCPKPQVLYKYLPRDFNTDSNYPEGISSTFKDMFRNPTPYIANLGNNNIRNNV